MKLIQKTAPASEPVDLTDAKAHCRVDITDDDDLITALITAARQRAEQFLQRSIITQSWYLYLDYHKEELFPHFLRDRNPEANIIKLPSGPLQSLTAFEYLSAASPTWTAVDPSWYYLDLPGEQIVLTPWNATVNWPVPVQYRSGYRITFESGFGDDGSDVPETIILGIKTLILHFYENREAYAAGKLEGVPAAGEALLSPHRKMDY